MCAQSRLEMVSDLLWVFGGIAHMKHATGGLLAAPRCMCPVVRKQGVMTSNKSSSTDLTFWVMLPSIIFFPRLTLACALPFIRGMRYQFV